MSSIMQVPLNRNVTHHPGGLNVEFTNTSPVLNQLQSHVVRIFPFVPWSLNQCQGRTDPATGRWLSPHSTSTDDRHLDIAPSYDTFLYVLGLKPKTLFVIFFGGAELFLRHILSLLDNKKKMLNVIFLNPDM